MFEYGIYEQLKLEYPKEFEDSGQRLDKKWEVAIINNFVFVVTHHTCMHSHIARRAIQKGVSEDP
jgi:hypothetical protein